MDARVASFMQQLGMEQMYRDLLLSQFAKLRATPAFVGKLDEAEHGQIAREGAMELAKLYGDVMEEKFRPKYLDALLKYMDSEEGNHIVFSLYMTQFALVERIQPKIEALIQRAIQQVKK